MVQQTNMTAVEWLVEELNIWQTIADEDTNATLDTVRKLLEQAKKMEKEQLNIARLDGINLANKGYGSKGNDVPELRYKDGSPMRKYNSPKLQELEQINQDNPITKGSTALVKVTSSQTEISDEEIREQAIKYDNQAFSETPLAHFMEGALWYREQLKKK